ncbi:hypothetical protein M407DRAFT_218466 [Tulasnella calospora MUT 4182]|uniref:DNA 3'-5' helicase n=1 Tax=Tulasnella calospora MUT 4182 TaxID=1051891 RepID=A0A0C3LJW7_9AGAM|nr:hypothetical protein M407DRAFT_218466 [Tulasnella calospora MUT 4182]
MYYPNESIDVFQEDYEAQDVYGDANLYGGFAESDLYSDGHPGLFWQTKSSQEYTCSIAPHPGASSPSPRFSNQAFRQRTMMEPPAAGHVNYTPNYVGVNHALPPSSSWQPQPHNPRHRTSGVVQRPSPRTQPPSSSRPQSSRSAGNPGGIQLVPVSSLPDMYRSVFKFGVFNAIQSQCFDTKEIRTTLFFPDKVVNTSQNMVISAPTGSGKTVIFELAIVRELLSGGTNHAKCVYMSPTKALCSERFNDWTKKFGPLGVKCCELTGDTVDTSRKAWKDAKDATIILENSPKNGTLSPETGENIKIFSQRCNFFLLTSTLEVCISRMKTRGTAVRFILLSATAPNIEDIASWVGFHSNGNSDRSQGRRAVVFKNQNAFQFSKTLDFKLFDLLQRHACGKPVLIFCPTRKGVFGTAEQLAKQYKKCVEEKRKLPWTLPGRVEGRFQDSQLNALLASGIGVHHAGLSIDDRKLAEELYLTGQIRTLVATSTLAVGVNLRKIGFSLKDAIKRSAYNPSLAAHTVVIKGTQMWAGTLWTEYCDLDIMQMLGRALLSHRVQQGRPQFDKEQHYRALTSGTTTIESCLHLNLTEHLNSEVGLGTITSLETAKSWLHNSFLFQRLKRNPSHYALGKDQNQTWEQRLDDLVSESVQSLCDADLVTTTRSRTGQISALAATELGEIMSRMRLILQLPDKVVMRDLVYNALKNHNDIRMTVKKIEKPTDKIMVLIQAVLGGISLNAKEYKTAESQPALEALGVLKHAVRIARGSRSAIVDTAIVKRSASQVKFGLELLGPRLVSWLCPESFSQGLGRPSYSPTTDPPDWREVAQGVIDMFTSGGGPHSRGFKVLASAGIGTIGALRVQEPHRLELLLNRKPPFGRDILEEVSALPTYRVIIKEESLTHSEGAEPVVASLAIEVGLDAPLTTPKGKKVQNAGFACILTVTSDMEFIDFRRVAVRALQQPRSFTIVARLEKPSQAIDVIVSSEQSAGLTVVKQYKPTISPKSYPTMKTRPKTELEAELEGLRGMDPSVWTVTDEEIMDLTTGVATPARTNKAADISVRLLRISSCREGVVKAPKSSRAATQAKSANLPQQHIAAPSSGRKTSVAPTSSKKPKARADIAEKTMKDLDQLQGSSNVGLKMPNSGRISLSSRSNEKKGTATQPPWINETGLSPKYSTLDSPRRMVHGDEDDDDELPDLAAMAPSVTKREKPAPSSASTDYSDELFNELLANADLESLSRPPERTKTKIPNQRKRSPSTEDEVVLVADSQSQPPPTKKARLTTGTMSAASSSRTLFSERNGRTVPLSLLSSNRTSATLAASRNPEVQTKRPLFLPSSPSPNTSQNISAFMLTDTNEGDPLPDAAEHLAGSTRLGEFGFDEELFEMEDDPLAGDSDDGMVGNSDGGSKVGSHLNSNALGTSREPRQGASTARPFAQEPDLLSLSLGGWGREPLRPTSFSSKTQTSSASSMNSSALQYKGQLHPKSIASTISTRDVGKGPEIATSDHASVREDGAKRKEIASGVERTGYDMMDDFFDWMCNSGEVEIVD